MGYLQRRRGVVRDHRLFFFTGTDPSGDPGSTSRVTLVALLNFSDLLIPHLKNGGKNTSQD